MPSKVPDVPIYRGDTIAFPPLRFLASVGGSVLNLSAWTWKAQWRKEPNSKAALNLVVDATSAVSGWIYVTAPASVTALMEVSGFWDLQGTLNGVVETKVFGKTVLTQDVTRDG